MSVTDEIKARIDIVDLIGSTVQLKKAGRNHKGLCPFHSEKTPSFVVFPDSQSWRCFGACNEGGDIFNFVMKREGWDFPEALRFLAEKAGVELQPMASDQAAHSEARDRLRSLLNDTAHFFYQQLIASPAAAFARQYAARRGLSTQTLEAFGIGYAPDSWDACSRYLIGLGYTEQELIDAGVVVVRDEGGTYDRFRDRLVIPIRDVRGSVVGFGARGLSAEAAPKYLNSPQSELFDKSSLLFGLDLARRAIRDGETAVIVEGYMDAIQAHQAGFANVVAQMGTALTEAQLKLLSRYANRLILALDPDTAGQMATDRDRNVMSHAALSMGEEIRSDDAWGKVRASETNKDGVAGINALERENPGAQIEIRIDARGMLHYEARLGFDIRVIDLPQGKDPDDLIREDPGEWARLVESALPIVEYAIQAATAGRNLDDPKIKSWIAGRIVPLISDIASPIERSHYRQRLARLLKVDERALFPEGSAIPQPRPARQPKGEPPRSPRQDTAAPDLSLNPAVWREAFGLAALIQHPRLIYRLNRVLAECMPPLADGAPPLTASLAAELTSADFGHPEHRLIFEGWCLALDQHESDPIPYLIEALDPIAQSRLAGWLDQPLYALEKQVMPPGADISAERVYEAAIQALLDLRRQRLDEHIKELQFLLSDADQNGDGFTVWDYGEIIRQLIAARSRLDQARRHYGAPGSAARSAFSSVKPL